MTGPATVILIEDDDALREATAQGLELAGFGVSAFARAEPALAAISAAFDGVIVSDIRLPGIDGMAVLARVRAIDPELPIMLVTGHGDVPLAVAALKQGATDFLPKPFAIDQLAAVVGRALAHRSLVVENRRLRRVLDEVDAREPLVGNSAAMVRLREAIAALARAGVDVLVEGEPGTGKDLVAARLHRLGSRRARPLVTVECESVDEVALFGHAGDRGAGGRLAREGLVTASSGGTLLLDGIETLAAPLQRRLLRAIEEREVLPVGAERAVAVDLRVLATTRTPLGDAVATGRFASGLHDRLMSARLVVPPLRTLGEDRLLLFATFLDEARAALGRGDAVAGPEARAWVLAHHWPGNVRELRAHAYQSLIGAAAVGEEEVRVPAADDLRTRVAGFEAAVIAEALRDADGNVVRAIERLGVPRKTFYDKLARHGIDPGDFRPARD